MDLAKEMKTALNEYVGKMVITDLSIDQFIKKMKMSVDSSDLIAKRLEDFEAKVLYDNASGSVNLREGA